jgi:colicin import membrane protein
MMTEKSLPQSDFKSALVISAFGHIAFALILAIRAYVFPSEPLRLESAIRVDIVGLPDKAINLPKPADSPAKEASAPPPPTSKDLPPIETTRPAPPQPPPVVLKPQQPDLKKTDPKKQSREQDAALRRLQALSKLESQAKADAAIKALRATNEAQAAVRGNQVSKGNSLSGLTRLDHSRYLDDLEARIKGNWRPPKFLSSSKLRVRVVLLIDKAGSILKRSIVQSSGNSVFDESALQAIAASEPLPMPPDTLHGILENQGVELDLEPSGQR